MKIAFLQSLKTLWHKFQRDESGIALIYITAALPVIIGFSLLAIDVGRLATLQSTMQHGTDALALAGAGELDRRPDAITRATNAINALLGADTTHNNKSLFATSVATVSVGTPCFLQTLPASDVTAITTCLPVASTANIAASSVLARYVQVSATPASFSTIFPVNFSGAGIATASATAVAGFDAAVCNFTPLFMCNPLEKTNDTSLTDDHGLFAMANSYTSRRNIIRFLAFGGGNNTPAVPGQFGFLDVGNGANALGNALAATVPPECYIQNTIQPKPGNMGGPLTDAFNTRFDIYGGSYKNSISSYPPSVNVRKGYIDASKGQGNGNGGACTTSPSTSTNNAADGAVMAFPVDSCFSDGSCNTKGTYQNSNIGNGDWGWDPDTGATVAAITKSGATNAYWALNFGSTAIPTSPDTPYSNSNPPSRYDVYRYEIATSGLLDKSSPTGGTGNGNNLNENGQPICAKSKNVNGVDTSTGSVDRRIIYGAIMNCNANNLRPGANGTYYSLAFGKFFIVRPVASSSTCGGSNSAGCALWTELVSLVYPGDGSGVARDRVQLYR